MTARRWIIAAGIAAAVLAGVLTAAPTTSTAQDDADERAKAAAEALEKAVARGKELFESRDLGRKTCVGCHTDPDKPQDDLREVAWSYPAYSRRARAVVTLQQKINEMIKVKARGQPLDPDGTDIAALAAYLESIRKK